MYLYIKETRADANLMRKKIAKGKRKWMWNQYIITLAKRALVAKKKTRPTFLIPFVIFSKSIKSMANCANIDNLANVVEYIRNMDPEQFANILDETFEEIDFEIDRDSDEDSGYASTSDFSEHDP